MAYRGKIRVIKMYTWKMVKRLVALAMSLLLVSGAAACSLTQAAGQPIDSSEAAAPPLSATKGTPPADTSPVSGTTSLPIITYGSQGWLLTSWDMAPLWTEPQNLTAGSPVEVWSNIYISDMPWSFIRVELYVNGEVADSRDLTLWFDDPLPFSLSFTPDRPGEYDITVRANMLENEEHARETGEDLSAYSSLTLSVA